MDRLVVGVHVIDILSELLISNYILFSDVQLRIILTDLLEAKKSLGNYLEG